MENQNYFRVLELVTNGQFTFAKRSSWEGKFLKKSEDRLVVVLPDGESNYCVSNEDLYAEDWKLFNQ